MWYASVEEYLPLAKLISRVQSLVLVGVDHNLVEGIPIHKNIYSWSHWLRAGVHIKVLSIPLKNIYPWIIARVCMQALFAATKF